MSGTCPGLPWSYGPWVLVLRSRPDLARRRAEGWDLLLDPSLAGRLVLPSSPRVAIALVGEDPERLRRLRRGALAYDERNGLNLLITGEAQAAVLPRQRLVRLLRRDPRLQVLLPASGAPLSWNLLLRPPGPHPPPPLEWLGAALEPPLLPACWPEAGCRPSPATCCRGPWRISRGDRGPAAPSPGGARPLLQPASPQRRRSPETAEALGWRHPLTRRSGLNPTGAVAERPPAGGGYRRAARGWAAPVDSGTGNRRTGRRRTHRPAPTSGRPGR